MTNLGLILILICLILILVPGLTDVTLRKHISEIRQAMFRVKRMTAAYATDRPTKRRSKPSSLSSNFSMQRLWNGPLTIQLQYYHNQIFVHPPRARRQLANNKESLSRSQVYPPKEQLQNDFGTVPISYDTRRRVVKREILTVGESLVALGGRRETKPRRRRR